MVAFLQKSTGSEEFHQIVDFLANSHTRYALTVNPTIYASLIEQFWQTTTVETVNNGEQQLSVTVDGQTIAITEASVRRHLQLADADDDADEAIIKEMHDGLARPERVSNLPNEPPLRKDKVTSLEDELASTKAVYNKALITLTKRDSPKQGRMIDEIDKDENVNLVKSSKLGKSHDTTEHKMESEHDDDDDRTLAETLLNIKRSVAKGKAIMHEAEPPKKIKKKEMRQISLDEEFAKSFYEEEQAQILQDETQISSESSKKTGGSRKKTLARKRAGEKQSKEGAKRQKTEYEKEKEELKAYLDLVPREEFSMEIESLGTKYPIVDWKTHVLTENFMYYQIIKTDGGSKNYKIFSEMLDDFDRQNVMDLHRLVEERYATSRLEGYDLMLWGNLKILFQPDKKMSLEAST
ncbi:hypothetical protein Tco_0283120 [Tanacetum coccineum]